jgi:hypothetical protein
MPVIAQPEFRRGRHSSLRLLITAVWSAFVASCHFRGAIRKENPGSNVV